MNALGLLHGLRFIDSFFPSGGYAYSSGLEGAVQEGAVRDAEGLREYVEEILHAAVGTREAVGVSVACEAIRRSKLPLALRADAVPGIAMGGLPEDTKLEDWDKILDVNLMGTFLCAR